jgi:hypothetical protein
MKRLLSLEPVLSAGVVQAAIALVVALGFHLTAGQSGAIEAATAGLAALIMALSVRPFQVPALTGALTAIGTLLVAFGVHGVQPNLVSSFNAALVAVLAIVLRGHVTPVASLPKPAAPGSAAAM